MATSVTETIAREKFWDLYRETFEGLYLYCARRATTKPVIAFIIKSLYEYALDEIRHGETIILVDLYKWAYEFFAVQSQPKMGGQVKRVHDFRDVYNVKTDSSSRAIRREQILENFYNHLDFKERESLWLTFFEELSEADRAYVMAMSGEESMKFFYENLKKAKQLVTMATSDQKGFGRLAAYFGGVSALLKKAKQDEEIDVDQEIYTSLRGIFMDQFSRNPQPFTPAAPAGAQTTSSAPTGSTVNSAMPPSGFPSAPPATSNPTPVSSQPASARTQVVRPVSSVGGVTADVRAAEARAVDARESFDDNDDWIDDEESFSSGLWRRVQGVLVLVMVGALGFFAYTKFFNIDARVDHLLQDTRVVFSSEFTPEMKTHFAKEALLSLVDGRDFAGVHVEQKLGGYVEVRFDLTNKGMEAFVLYPEQQTFDFPHRWQPRQYVKIVSVG